MIHLLGKIANIYYGPYCKAHTKGIIKYLNSGHFNDLLEPSLFEGSYVNAVNNPEKYLLKLNDVIVTGKGQRIFAWAYKSEYGEVIPSSLFFIIKIKFPNKINGEYLAAFLNSDKINHQLKSLSAGTSLPTIQKKELEQLPVFIPSMEKQSQIINLARLLDKDVALTSQLLEMKKAWKAGIINRIIHNNTTA